MKKLYYLIFVMSLFFAIQAGEVNFTSSNLPIVILNTLGKEIPDEPKITAQMKIIWNQDGSRNNVADTDFDYNGMIGIEMRGSTSQSFFPKKQYAVETRDGSGDNLNVSLLGLPEENDWILHAPYSDKTLMRNVLAYTLSGKMGWYASRCKFVELVLNNQYQGVYILMEKIKRDKGRVDISNLKPEETSGDDLTGGYIIKIDKFTGDNNGGWQSNYPAKTDPQREIFYQYHVPKNDEIVEEQKQYIQQKVDEFESVIYGNNFDDPVNGYSSVINPASFIDFTLVNELAKNVDGFRLSTFLYKDKDSNDPRFYAGPIWDFNIAFGNANYYQGEYTDQWILDVFEFDNGFQWDGNHPPFYFRKLWNCGSYRTQAENRWKELREGVLSNISLNTMIDSITTLLSEAQERNFQRWDEVLGNRIWPNPAGYENRTTYESEVNYIKNWLAERLKWMDENISASNVSIDQEMIVEDFCLLKNYPNPFNPTTTIQFQVPKNTFVSLNIFNLNGELIETLCNSNLEKGVHKYQFNGSGLSSGVYLFQLNFDNKTITEKALLIK